MIGSDLPFPDGDRMSAEQFRATFGKGSHGERVLAMSIDSADLPRPDREVRFHPTRMWRFDFAWPAVKLAVEVEGGIFTRGRHTRGAGARADVEKYAEALILGWRVLRVSTDEVKNGKALGWIRRALDAR